MIRDRISQTEGIELGNLMNGPVNRLPYNIRQRVPSLSGSDGDVVVDDPCQEECVFTDKTHPTSVLKGLGQLQKEGQFCDVTLLVDGKKFPVHRNVLAAFSPYFKAMFTNTLAESKQVKPSIFTSRTHQLDITDFGEIR